MHVCHFGGVGYVDQVRVRVAVMVSLQWLEYQCMYVSHSAFSFRALVLADLAG
jgi:hypothetical protein